MTPYKNQRTVHEKKNTNQYKNGAISLQTLELPYKRVRNNRGEKITLSIRGWKRFTYI